MTKILSPREYNIRSLAYYQAEGGVYNDIITILTKMRSEPEFRGLPSPAKSLNEACFLYDMKQQRDLDLEEEKKYISEIDGDLSKVLVAVMATAWEEDGYFIAHDRYEYIGDANPYLHWFDNVFEGYLSKEKEAYDSFADAHVISDLQDELNAKDSLLATANDKILELQDELQDVQQAKENLLATANAKIEELQKLVDSLSVRNESKYDKALSRKGILEYVENQRIYSNVNQIFEMLLGPMSRVATDEEYNEVVALRQKLIDASVPTIRNEIRDSNVFTGVVNHPNFPIGGDPVEIIMKAVDLVLKKMNDGKE